MHRIFTSLPFFGAANPDQQTTNPASKTFSAGLRLSTSAILTLALLAQPSARATPILGSASVSSPQGNYGAGFDLVKIINQSGLSSGYIAGATDFTTFTSSATHTGLGDAGFTATQSNGPQQFTFDLGTSKFLDGIAIWNTTSVGRVTSFSLFSDTDSNFGNGTSSQLLGATALGNGGGLAYVFTFALTNTRYIHVNALASLDPPDFYGLGEVAFRSAVPEPSTIVFATLGLLGLVCRRRT